MRLRAREAFAPAMQSAKACTKSQRLDSEVRSQNPQLRNQRDTGLKELLV